VNNQDQRDNNDQHKQPERKRVKWEPAAAMIALFALGLWLVFSGRTLTPQQIRPGAYTLPLQIANEKGVLEVREPAEDAPTNATTEFRLLFRNGQTVGPIDPQQFAQRFGQTTLERARASGANPLFKLLNITSWPALAWVALGFAGQAAFFARMALQWIASEKERRSVVPPAFWYLSLAGGAALFAYFAWRQDIVGVTGQTSGIVIYARNLRLIHKEKRRAARPPRTPRDDNQTTHHADTHAQEPAPAGAPAAQPTHHPPNNH
jgi:lipid-A-disaccharide synthase-like uncharacterized protein